MSDWVSTLRHDGAKALGLAGKALDQWLDGDSDRDTTALFLVGCQRSGTTLLIDVLRHSPSIWVHPEKNPLVYDDFRLRSPATTAKILWATPADVAVFKPLCDAHLTDRLLDLHPGSKAVWLVRDWRDVATSAVAKWGDHQLEVIRAIVEGRASTVGWRGERLPPALVDQLREVWSPDLDPVAGAALFWYVRNSFFHGLGLDDDPRVRLVRYGDLVTRPADVLAEVFGHVEALWDPTWADQIEDRRRGADVSMVPADITALCQALQARFDATLGHARAA